MRCNTRQSIQHLYADIKLLQGTNDKEAEDGNRESGRNLRSSALRFWATVLQRFPEGADYNCFWPRFLQAVEPQMERMPTEVQLHSQILHLCCLLWLNVNCRRLLYAVVVIACQLIAQNNLSLQGGILSVEPLVWKILGPRCLQLADGWKFLVCRHHLCEHQPCWSVWQQWQRLPT